ncbi:uncharacterized protein SPAPADRAFT_58243 [Spathaspora passalidarum NRRL Y-27907]|uniref:DNA-directed RNA polymerase III subunit RPC4 n=1 Tax=Spathaspora passalidarum (strain NRRL Y-27907 / 11-Y1) TaxID=619300 RepID=G3AFW2_SPAPN|nr:uncharacterized protein SPAPADRAFT_58243 [Spathaspora passalidarum NRRL Y-27907]EGW35101.1 hypothetical protein SPAPADRAFT_58243 [Spathaspora passalidarum NRRL Y-27907]
MSNRLESLNSKKPAGSPAPKGGLKFKPKVVQRKSKEERDKDAPIIKQEQQARQPATRGRGSTRGRGRGGRNAYAGTHLVTSGPLSAGSVSIGNVNGSKSGLTSDSIYSTSMSPTPEFLQNLKLKDRPKSVTPGAESEEDEEDDPTRINMTQQYRFADEETVLFPVRPDRTEVEKDTTTITLKSEEPTRENTPAFNRESPVKSEPLEDKIEKIKVSKAKLQERINQTDDPTAYEENKLLADHQQILDLLTHKFDELSTDEVPDDKFILFQLPNHLPEYIDKQQDESSEVKQEQEQEPSQLAVNKTNLRGRIGNINIHQSGKISIDLGNGNKLTVAKGAPTNFLQELACIEYDSSVAENEDVEMLDEQGRKVMGKVIRLGTVDEKVIATPYIK